MKLRSLTLQGFKSFADRTELRFHEGITAVVGPNGCGKSNISDAIRWVLGEQRASAIRGSRMDEVIFQGTAERRALNRAEISLAFSNEDGRLALPYEEIEIRRTIFREGGSEYHLNRTPCRLRDIADLCRDTGLGATAYAVIEQGMVDAILSDRADERRHLFEEAAGIGRYKDRRKAAQRRLEAAEVDLARLQDLITEVDSKVRNLGRQRRRAQRYQELRARRLGLEVTLALAELEALHAELAETAARLTRLTQDEPAARAALSAAEAELERRRIAGAEATRARSAVAARVEEVSRRIAERDRELAVADERRAHAERRLAQIAVEREELQSRRAALLQEKATLEADREVQDGRLEALAEQLQAVQARQSTLRESVVEARRRDEQARTQENELTRRAAEAEAAAARADARAAEGHARLRRIEGEREELVFELARLGEQGDLFAGQARDLAGRRADGEAEREAVAEALLALRARETSARRAVLEAEDRANLLAAQLAALEALERDFHGYLPAVAAALATRDRLDGVLGPLTELLQLDAERAAAVEHTLGSLLQLLVVRDAQAAEAVRAWLAEAGPGDGALAMIPRELLPVVESLLEGVRFAGEAPSEPVLLGRRERLATLREEAAAAATAREACVAERVALAERIAAVEEELRERDSMLQALELEMRRAEADEAARTGQQARLQRTRDDLERQHAELLAATELARAEAARAREERASIEAELATLRDLWQARTHDLSSRESAWEAVRDEESELRVVYARAEAARTELDRRLAAARSGIEHSRMRLEAIDREETEHRESLEQLAAVRSDAGTQLEDLFVERERLAFQLRTLDEHLAAEGEACDALESQIRSLRRSGEERGEDRHRLELRRAEREAAVRGIRDRLEAEWGRVFDRLVAEAERIEGEPDLLRAELQTVAVDIERLGPVNMLAVEEYEEESQRLEFLSGQRDDLVRAKEDLQTAIRQINRQARELFLETFEQIRANFHRTFDALFEGGSCDIWLADPDDPLESAIEVSASPRGKRTQRIHLLSGGERALTALSLLFAIYLVKPSPFCVLDEVDAPLDEANVGRFVAMLQEFKAGTQFVVITHNPRTMEAADWIYGVTMEELGISTIVGVQIDEALTGQEAAD